MYALREGSPQFSVFLLGDPLLRRGLHDVLTEDRDLDVIGEAGTAVEAVESIARRQPDVVVMDLQLADRPCEEACREILEASPGTSVLLVASGVNRDALFPALIAGAAGFVFKDAPATDVRAAVRTVGQGGSLVDPHMTARLLEWLREFELTRREDNAVAALTPREHAVLELLGDGLTNRQIGEALGISEKTVRGHCSRIFLKLHIEHRTQAAAIATERRLRSRGEVAAAPRGA